MKGLLIKDLRLVLRQQRATLFLIMAVILLVLGAAENPMFGILYTVFLLPVLLISTISYDTFENGMPFLMALPISVKDYVAEKYLLTVGGSVLVNVLATGLTYLIQIFKGGEVDIMELLLCTFTAQSVILLYAALVLPINMRYGAEKGRIIIIIMAIAIGTFFSGSDKLLEAESTGAAVLLDGIYQFGVVELLLMVMLICAVLTGISYFVCVKWMEKKEY